MEDPVDAVFVIGSREDVRDKEFTAAGYNYRVVSEVILAWSSAAVTTYKVEQDLHA